MTNHIMFCWRITKYNPKYRNEKGYYLKDEWIDYSDIGKIFEGKKLTYENYIKVEDSYIQAVLLFMKCLEIDLLKVTGLEKSGKNPKSIIVDGIKITNNKSYDLKAIYFIIQSILRNKFWCRLESNEMYVHFGWDYYMYIGCIMPCESTIKAIRNLGLFVEEFTSPYHPEEDDD